MTSTHVGLPDRYRPLDEVGPVENTPTGVIHTWRAKDRVLNRDVAIRVHTPGGTAAHAWIARALTAGGLLISVAQDDALELRRALIAAGVPAVEIGEVLSPGKPLIVIR